ncbi:MAG: ATP-binding cassette domain-containing protein [Saprospiraceae bacterium]
MILPLVLEMHDASMGQGDKVVFEHVDFGLANAEMCYMVGRSGSGKSTFLKTLYGSIPLLAGDIKIAGFDLGTIKRKDIPLLRRSLGMVFQDFHLFEKWTVFQNLEYVLKATEWKDKTERENRVEEVLAQVKLSNKSLQPIHKLSGGEQQKVVIARAILNKPTIIIADEPTGNLDAESSEEVMSMLYNLANENNAAILIATHDNQLIEKFPARIFKCENGNVIEL